MYRRLITSFKQQNHLGVSVGDWSAPECLKSVRKRLLEQSLIIKQQRGTKLWVDFLPPES